MGGENPKSDVDQLQEAILKRYKRIDSIASDDFQGLERISLQAAMCIASRSAWEAANMLRDVEFDNPEDRESVFQAFLSFFEINRYLGVSSSDELRVLLQQEIEAFRSLGFLVQEGKDQYTNESHFLGIDIGGSGVSQGETEQWLGRIRDTQIEVFGIAETIQRLQYRYGFNITYEVFGNSFYSSTVPTLKQIKLALIDMELDLQRYPRFMIRDLGPALVYFVTDLVNKQTLKSVGGFQYKSKVVINIDNGIFNALHHEFFHRFDHSDGMRSEDKPWLGLHPKGNLAYKNASEAHDLSHDHYEERSEFSGFARLYGKENVMEDQATVAEALMILNHDVDGKFLDRCVSDGILRTKVELVSGCKFDVQTQRFARSLTLQEWNDYGFEGPEYYAKWSKDEDGRVWMDSKYWNTIIDGDPMKFD